MKYQKLFLIIIILLIPVLSLFAGEIDSILQKIETSIQNINLLSISCSYKTIYSEVTDSVTTSKAKIWLKVIPSDTIFGAYFHVQGEDNSGEFDYFYDGKNAIELRHQDKSVLIFNPYAYPNTPSNRAKARIALVPLNLSLIDRNFYKTKTIKNPISEVYSNNKLNQITISLKYPENEYGQKVTEIFEFDKNTNCIFKIKNRLNWNGLVFKENWDINNYSINSDEINNHIYLQETYDNYTRKYFNGEKEEKLNSHIHFIGKNAPKFQYKSVFDEIINLDSYKGKFVLLDFWESWCGHCLVSFPSLNNIQEKYDKKLQVIGITTENKQIVKKLIKDNELIYPTIYGDKKILNDYKISNRPTYVLIDQKGKIIKVSYGDLKKINETIENMIN